MKKEKRKRRKEGGGGAGGGGGVRERSKFEENPSLHQCRPGVKPQQGGEALKGYED